MESKTQKFAKQLAAIRERALLEYQALDIERVEVSVDWDYSCKAVKEFDGQTFTLDAVPSLPVEGCDMDYCRCMYLSAEQAGQC